MKRIFRILAPGMVAAIFLAAGCLTTSTYVITAKLAPPIRTITNANYNDITTGKIVVNLEDYPDFKDNKDKIASIDNLGFYLRVKNNASIPVTFQLFLMPDTSVSFSNPDAAASFASGASLVFTGLALPSQQKVTVDWNNSLQYISSFDEIKDALKSGHFSLYPAIFYGDAKRDSLKLEIDSLVVVVTLTGG